MGNSNTASVNGVDEMARDYIPKEIPGKKFTCATG